MKYYKYIIGAIFTACLLPLAPASAFCPVCTIAVAGGLGLSRYLGVDDTISGVWVGALMIAMTIWTADWLKKKKIDFKWMTQIVGSAYYLLVVAPLYYYDIIGHPLNKLWGIDKLLLGVIMGSIYFLVFGEFYKHLKQKNGGKAHFPFQKVVMPISPLIVWSILFYFLTK